ncbi:MAG: sigma-54 dependent transcriptional regulator [Acidobacteriota bacterium]
MTERNPHRAANGRPGEAGAASPIRVLLAEDDAEMRDLIDRVLTDEGYAVIPAADGHQAARLLEAGAFDLVLTDVRMPGPDGMEILRRAMARRLHQPIILMTAFGSIESAVGAMREGAYHYLAKPFDIEDLLEIVAGAAMRVRHLCAVHAAGVAPSDPLFPIVFRSQAMADLLRMVADVADSAATVLITGSSGTGKELLARAIHAMSRRRDRPFVPVDCSAIPETLIESELFGHRRGSFTGAVADKRGIVEEAAGGSLFLDEVGNLPAPIQSKLLRFLQERRFRRVGEVEERAVDARVISATNQNLQDLIARGSFRQDLFYRLSVIPIALPDLAARREDIPPLVYHFIRKFNAGYQVEGIRPDALDLLIDHSWPGNVRQLENVIERAVILRRAGLIQPRDLPAEILGERSGQAPGARSLEEMERRYTLQLLRECGGNQSRVARILGIDRRTLYRKLRRYSGEGDDAGFPGGG